jgi:hypothetical protein
VALGLLFTGVALHATFDYSGLQRLSSDAARVSDASAPNPPQNAAAAGAGNAIVDNGEGEGLVFEQAEKSPSLVRSPFATGVAQLAITLVAIVAILRLLVWQAGKRAMTPLIYAALAVLLVVGAWLLIDSAALVSKAGN